MSDTESLDYLQSAFDPSSLTIPRLRSILVQYDVRYPATAKKAQLVELFNENILPQSRKILDARVRARRTSRGITNASPPRAADSAPDSSMPPPPTPKPRGTSRKGSYRVKVEDSESETTAPRSMRKTPRVSSRSVRVSDPEEGEDESGRTPATRKSRRSGSAAVKDEPTEESTPRQSTKNDSAFSYDNPFQSGSSPTSDSKTPSEKRRKSEGPKSSTKTKIGSSRRSTDVPLTIEDDNTQSMISKKYEVPVSRLNGLIDVDANGVTADEEFTPEEQMELVRDRATNGINAVSRRSRKKSVKSSGAWKTASAAVLTVVLGGYSAWYAQEKRAVGYCGVGRDARPLIPVDFDGIPNVPDWVVQLVEPQCEPCPPHAFCSSDMRVTCEQDFVLKQHPLSLSGLVPIAPTCEPDGEKVRKVMAVADRAVEEMRERTAKWECGDRVEKTGEKMEHVEIAAEDLKQEVASKRRRGMDAQEFEDLWASALGEITKREEVVSNHEGLYAKDANSNSSGPRLYLHSTSLAAVPLACALRRSIRLTVARYRLRLAGLAAFIAILAYVRHKILAYASDRARVPELVDMTLERLSTQAALHAHDPDTAPEAYIAIGQLRDDVLRSEHSAQRRERLWQRVRPVVEMNANVRASQRESRSGEVSRVWEWIGALDVYEGGMGQGGVGDGEPRRRSKGRKSGRVSFYGGEGSPVSGSDEGLELISAKWAEGRPAY